MKSTNFKWWHALIAYFSYLLALIVSSFLSSGLDNLLQDVKFNQGALSNVLMFVLAGLFCLFLLRIASKNQLSSYEFGIHLNSILKTTIIGISLGLLFFGFSELIEASNKTIREGGEQVMENFNIGKNITNDFLLILSIGLFAPVVEEIIFRGAIFNSIVQGLKKITFLPKWLPLIIGLIVSSYAFVSSHGGGGQDAQLGLLAILSIITALSIYYTKNLFAPILIHAVNNNVVFIYTILYRQPRLDPIYSAKLIGFSIACLILCIPLGLLLGKILSSKASNK